MTKNLRGFLKLLDRYQKKKLNPDEKQVMDAWYDAIDHSDQEKNVLNEDEAGKVMWSVISEGISEESEMTNQIHISRWWQSVYFRLSAACFLFILGLAVYRSVFIDKPVIAGVKNEVIENMLRVSNTGSGQKSFTLPDGSLVNLEPGAILYYPETFASNERNVFLKGNVFFEISHDRQRPFLVHANNIVTKVLGTSFTIRENPETNSIEVAVMTGVVEVQQMNDPDNSEQHNNKVVLTQNKRVTFYQKEEKLVTGLVQQPKILKAKQAEIDDMLFNYVEKPLSQIVPVLEDAYGVKIGFANEKLRNCIITADMSQEKTLFAQLEILCESIDAKYVLKDDGVILSGNGCELSNKFFKP